MVIFLYSIDLIFDHLSTSLKEKRTSPVGTFHEVVLNLQINWGELKLSWTATSCSKASCVSPFIHVFFLFPFIKFYSLLHIGPTNAQFLKSILQRNCYFQ